jgi:hypothetical protein
MSKPSATITVPEVIERFASYHEEYAAWGSLHIVLDDFNLADHHVQFCIDYAEEKGDIEGAELARILLKMSPSQRKKIGRTA